MSIPQSLHLGRDLLAVGAAILIAYGVYITGLAIYNITLHPLAKFPGPNKWAAFWWPQIWSMFRGSEVEDIARLHEKYGEVVRTTPNTLSFSVGQAWKDVYGFQRGKSQWQKDWKMEFQDPQDKLPPNLFQAPDAVHARYRRLLANAFSDHALREQEDILNTYFALLVKKLKEEIDGPNKGKVNMVAWYNWTTFDIIGALTFSEPFHGLEAGKYHPWIWLVFETIKHGRWLRLGARYPAIWATMRKLQSILPDVRRYRAAHMGFTMEKVQQRLDADTDRKDFFHFILRHNDEKGMTRQEMIANASGLVIAGSETTATLLSGATYYLLRNPEKLERLQKEVRSAFVSVDEMTLISVSKLPYLHAVIEESLRMYPPVANSLPRVVPAEGATIGDYKVPGGTVVGVHQWSTYRNSNNFAEPDTFAPERFLRDPPAKYRGDNLEALQPFSIGPRGCIGQNLAHHEMRSILARMVYCFDWELCPESVDWKDQKTFFLWQKGDLMVQLRHREL